MKTKNQWQNISHQFVTCVVELETVSRRHFMIFSNQFVILIHVIQIFKLKFLQKKNF